MHPTKSWVMEGGLSVLAIVVLALGLSALRPGPERADASFHGDRLERIAFIDRMVGTKLDLPIILGQATFEDRESGGGAPLRLVRILDLARCAECLSDLAAWNAATSTELLDGLLLS